MTTIRIALLTGLTGIIVSVLAAQGAATFLEQAQAEMAARNWAAAAELLQLALQQDDTSAPAHFEQSKLALVMDDLKGAQQSINAAIENDPRNEEYREQANRIAGLSSKMSDARRAYGTRDYLGAVAIYEALIVAHPSFASAYFGMGMAFTKAELRREAADAFRRAQELNPADSRYRAALRNLVADRYNAGNRSYRARDWEVALATYQEAVAIDPTFHQAYVRLAKSQLMLGENDAALKTLDQALAVKPDYTLAYVEKGSLLRREDRFEEAKATYRQALAVDRQSDRAWVELGMVLRRDSTELAIDAFKSALAANPKNGDAAEHLGEIYSEEENWDTARRFLTQAVELKSKDHVTVWRLAHVYNALGDYDQARLSAKRSTDLKKSFEYGWYEKGLAEKALGNRQAAIVAFREAKKGRDAGIRESATYELRQLETRNR